LEAGRGLGRPSGLGGAALGVAWGAPLGEGEAEGGAASLGEGEAETGLTAVSAAGLVDGEAWAVGAAEAVLLRAAAEERSGVEASTGTDTTLFLVSVRSPAPAPIAATSSPPITQGQRRLAAGAGRGGAGSPGSVSAWADRSAASSRRGSMGRVSPACAPGMVEDS
jgi:hypothetical protein